jgi:hypothetical protein
MRSKITQLHAFGTPPKPRTQMTFSEIPAPDAVP